MSMLTVYGFFFFYSFVYPIDILYFSSKWKNRKKKWATNRYRIEIIILFIYFFYKIIFYNKNVHVVEPIMYSLCARINVFKNYHHSAIKIVNSMFFNRFWFDSFKVLFNYNYSYEFEKEKDIEAGKQAINNNNNKKKDNFNSVDRNRWKL